QEHVLLLDVAEVLRHRQRRQRHTQPGPRGLVHLAEDQGGVRKDTHLVHLQEEVRTLTGALTDTGEHGHTTEVAGDTGDHLLDQYRLAHTGTTEQTDLPTTHVRGEQVDHLDTGDQHLGLGLELVEVRGLAVDRPVLGHLQLGDRKSTRLNSSHVSISYAVFCLKKKTK